MSAPRVVLVDDTEDLRHLMRIALRRAGYEVVGEAGDGEAGIDVARAESPDLVVLDLSMPVMDGLEALPHIRAACPDATIAVMSGFGADRMTERALARGADGYLQKGAPLADVVARLAELLGRRGGTPPAAPPTTPAPPASAPAPPDAPDRPDSVELAPVALLELANQPDLALTYANAAARELLGPGAEPGTPVAQLSADLAAFVAGFRVDADTTLDLRLGGRHVQATLRRGGTGLLVYLDPSSGEAAALRRAIATTAHEIRGPVTVIAGAAETLDRPDGETLDTDDVAELTSAMARQARILDDLTSDLLAAAQGQFGTLTLDAAEVRPADVIATVLTGRYDAGLVVTDDRRVRADPRRLEQMLTNLLSNARKYGRPPIDVHVRPAGERVAIDVVDHGDGVPEQFRERLFQEFARADSAPAAGTGLGLHVVRTLAEAHGGSASYAPRPDGGAVFTIELPAV